MKTHTLQPPWQGQFLVLVVAAPLLLAVAPVPDAVIYNQLLALGLWGAWCAFSAPALMATLGGSLRAALAGMLLLAATALASPGWAARSMTDVLLMVAAAVLLVAGSQRRGTAPWLAWSRGWLILGLASVLIAAVQYFNLPLADSWLIASSTTPGRAVGNLRQPNHLATALLCAIVMTAWLWQAGRLRGGLAGASIGAMVFAVALSASRTGALSLGVLLLWALLDRSLPRTLRWTLALTPLLYLVFWAGLAQYAEWQHAHFYAAERLQSGSDISSSRFAIWRNALVLVSQNPWTGVGWGNFNVAWTFTPFPDRPVAFFDHTHNLPLQLAVEIGLPATAAVLGLLAWALWRARGALALAGGEPGHPARAAFVMLVVLGVHSMLEYPLWYAYFLLPAAWALGVFLGSAPGAAGPGASSAPAPAWTGWLLRAAGVAMVVGAAYAAWDHRRIEVIFTPPPGAAPLAARIAEGRRSVLFGDHADYAAVTTEPRDQSLPSFRRPLHQLVDVRLLIAYIEALRANGRDAEALYAAQRLREFKRPDAQAWFAECDEPEPAWQCDTRPVQGLDWRGLVWVAR